MVFAVSEAVSVEQAADYNIAPSSSLLCRMRSITSWDLFCRVVDNYGDIGVCWRLARQLTQEHGHTVRLWVDDLRAFEKLCPPST
jgi:hypothetical protein